MAVEKLEVRVPEFQLIPHFPRSEILLLFIYVMQQNNASRAHLGKPSLKIVFDCFVCVVTVDMKNIDRSVRKVLHSFVKCALYEVRKSSIQRIMVRSQIC